jgi:carboxypeptidase Taq
VLVVIVVGMQSTFATDVRYLELRAHLQQLDDVKSALGVLYWDQNTYMPTQGASSRGRHIATLTKIAHEALTQPRVGELIELLSGVAKDLPADSIEASYLRVAKRDHLRAVQVPADFVAKLSAHQSETYEVWGRARASSNFALVRSHLEKTVDLSRQLGSFYKGYASPADALIDESDAGMTSASLKKLFSELRAELVPLVEEVLSRPPADDSCLHAEFPEGEQLAFCRTVAAKMGYDFKRGRLDLTLHPFMIGFGVDDVRILTRVRETDLSDALFSTVHEAGHAFYEMGMDPAFEGTHLRGGASTGLHESQSRLWENIVARSRGFWEYFYPQLQSCFGSQLGKVSLDTFYKAINKVSRSLIRTDADELTYNLHVMIRFDLEQQMLEGTLKVADLPEAWNARYQSDLGIRPPSDKDGCLQDVHWYGGTVGGYFQGYTLGNILSAQFYAGACKAHPSIPDDIRRGHFEQLHSWLRAHLYRHGRKWEAPEMIKRALGEELSIKPYMSYLRGKYLA